MLKPYDDEAMLRALYALHNNMDNDPPNLEETRAQLYHLIGVLIERARSSENKDWETRKREYEALRG